MSSDFSAVRELVETYNSRATPTIVIDGKILVGFDPEALDEALGG